MCAILVHLRKCTFSFGYLKGAVIKSVLCVCRIFSIRFALYPLSIGIEQGIDRALKRASSKTKEM